MKKIIETLTKQLEKLREHVQYREDYFCDKSEKWQESDKGEDYEDKTNELDGKADELDTFIDELKELS